MSHMSVARVAGDVVASVAGDGVASAAGPMLPRKLKLDVDQVLSVRSSESRGTAPSESPGDTPRLCAQRIC